jgi:AcrR family transcriptional regulator
MPAVWPPKECPAAAIRLRSVRPKRPGTSALGTSTRMLLYDFSSKEDLVIAVLTEIRRREAALLAGYTRITSASGPELVQAVWEWASSAERAPFMRLFFEVYIDAMANPGAYSQQGHAMVTEWLQQIGTALAGPTTDAADAASATLVIAVTSSIVSSRSSGHLVRRYIATPDRRAGRRSLKRHWMAFDYDVMS